MLSRMDPRGAARGRGPSGQVAFSDASAYADALATTVTSGELQPGDQLAGYAIEAVLGRGGMGIVYRAFDARLGRPVALKLIAPERAQDERFRERFLVESQLAASLDHSNVVPVYDAGEAEGVSTSPCATSRAPISAPCSNERRRSILSGRSPWSARSRPRWMPPTRVGSSTVT